MLLKGSCSCGAVKFSVKAYAPVPYSRCYCSICRKTAGCGGYSINLGAKSKTLKVKGKKNISVYRARIGGKKSHGRRNFCKRCGSFLWVYDPDWPDLVHPFAGAIDSKLPVPPANVHIMLDSKANWVRVEGKKGDQRCREFPRQSLEEWHRARGLLSRA